MQESPHHKLGNPILLGVLSGSFAFLWLILCADVLQADEKLFKEQVAPIFERHCVGCHQGSKPKGAFSLVTRELLLKGGESGPAIEPGNASASLLIDYISGESPEMPLDAKPLSADEVAVIGRWIKSGAHWPANMELVDKKINDTAWWSLQPLKQVSIPSPEASDPNITFRVRNPIDAFILTKLQEQELSPSAEADRSTLIRRLYYDLIGLPPTPAEVKSFLKDSDPSAYEKLVDKLLNSPRYGERWGRHWLDVVHYGDTHGYDKDKPRPHAWPYRDYVIRAFNEDKPYSRFVQEQIAGDILFPNTTDGITALGFISAGPWDFIGHAEVSEEKTDGKIARMLDRDDMVSNAMNTFNSTTVQCARCHNHKFDPVTQEDYYSLQAIFAALDRTTKQYDTDPTVAIKRQGLVHQQQKLLEQQADIEARMAKLASPRLADLNQQIDAIQEPIENSTLQSAAYGYHSQLATKADSVKWVQVDLGQPLALSRVILQPCFDNYNNIGAGFGFPVRFRVEGSTDSSFHSDVTTFGDYTEADFPNPKLQRVTLPIQHQAIRYIRITATKLAARKNDFMLALAEVSVLDASGRNVSKGTKVTAKDSIEAPPRWRLSNLVDTYYPGSKPSADSDKLPQLQAERDALLLRLLGQPTLKRISEISSKLTDTEAKLSELPPQQEVFIGGVHHGQGSFRGTGAKGGKPREIHVLARGDVCNPLQLAQPGVPPLLVGQPTRFQLTEQHTEGERRAAFARWLTEKEHPLTWRSIVNRIWQYHFGRGIVHSPNDFGRMGLLPSHPELLDWLALEFRDGGQSMKAMHRLICTSSTYRQSSENRPAFAMRDADNVYLWRMNRRRLEAEAIRDSVLQVSGKLNTNMGGPGFQDFVIEQPAHSPHYEYQLFDPEDPRCHRRSVYRFIVRSQPQPFMTTLDCADPSLSVDKRNESISVLQSLAMLNNKFMVVMAKHFAKRLENEAPDLPSRIDRGVWLTLGRAPTANEREKLLSYAIEFGLPNTCRVLLNLNEFVFVE